MAVAQEHRWMVEMEIETHLGQRALYKIPFWAPHEKAARHQGAKHANEMQSGVVSVRSLDVYRVDDSTIVLPGLYPLDQRHHLHRAPVAPFDSVQNLPSFERSLKEDFWRGGKYTSLDAHARPNENPGFLYAGHGDDDEEEHTRLLFDSIEADATTPPLPEGQPLWRRLLCCVGCKGKTETVSRHQRVKTHQRIRADSW